MKKPWTPDQNGIMLCEHVSWPKTEFTIRLGAYTLLPCMQCYRQIKATVLEDLLAPYLNKLALDLEQLLQPQEVKLKPPKKEGKKDGTNKNKVGQQKV